MAGRLLDGLPMVRTRALGLLVSSLLALSSLAGCSAPGDETSSDVPGRWDDDDVEVGALKAFPGEQGAVERPAVVLGETMDVTYELLGGHRIYQGKLDLGLGIDPSTEQE